MPVGHRVERAWTDDTPHAIHALRHGGPHGPAGRTRTCGADRTRGSLRRIGGHRSGVYPAGQASGPGPGRALDRRPAPRAPASRGSSSAASTCGHLVVRRRVGRIGEHEVARPGRAGAAGQHPLHPVGRPAARRAARRAAMFSRITRAARASDSTSSTSAAPRDSASRPTAPEPAYRSSTAAPSSAPRIAVTVREQALPGPVAGRPGGLPGRHGQPPAAGQPGDDPGHRPRGVPGSSALRPSRGTRPARRPTSAATARPAPG